MKLKSSYFFLIFSVFTLLLTSCSKDSSISFRDSDRTEKFILDEWGEYGSAALDALNNGASLRTSTFFEPIDDFKSNRNCNIDFLWKDNEIKNKDGYSIYYGINGNPDYMIKYPENYKFASDMDQAIAALLSYAVDLRDKQLMINRLEENKEMNYLGPDFAKSVNLYKIYVKRILQHLKLICNEKGITVSENNQEAKLVKAQLLNRDFRDDFNYMLDSIESNISSLNKVEELRDEQPKDIIYCEEKKTNLKDFSLVTCYP